MSEVTVKTELEKEVEQEDIFMRDVVSEDDEGCDAEHPPWVDRIQLRHGMDWLDLIADEVDRDTTQAAALI